MRWDSFNISIDCLIRKARFPIKMLLTGPRSNSREERQFRNRNQSGRLLGYAAEYDERGDERRRIKTKADGIREWQRFREAISTPLKNRLRRGCTSFRSRLRAPRDAQELFVFLYFVCKQAIEDLCVAYYEQKGIKLCALTPTKTLTENDDTKHRIQLI